MVRDLLLNVTLLLALATLYGLYVRIRKTGRRRDRFLVGLLFGAVALAAMMAPFHEGPGVIYDGRSIVLSLAGLFGGGLAGAVAALVAAIYRINIGGAGTAAGVATILTSVGLGVAFRRKCGGRPERLGPAAFYLFGFTANACMLLCQFLLPWPRPLEALSQVALPVLVVFPLATMVMGVLMGDEERRVTAEGELAESEERFRALFEQAAVGVAQIETATGRFLRVNRRYCDILGYSLDEVRRLTFQAVTHPDDLQEDLDNLKRLVAGQIREFTMEKRYFRKDGSVVWVNLTASPMWRQGEPPDHHIAVVEDITERMALEEQLRHSQKLEAIGRLAGGVAHDFNNMLNIILIYAELALRKLGPDDPLRKDMEEIQAAARRSGSLTKQLLAFARKQVSRPQVLDLNLVIGETAKMLSRLVGEDVAFTFLPGRDLWPVFLDPTQVDQVLANLAVNARDAIHGVGQVSLETSNATVDEAGCEGTAIALPGDYVVLTFTDSGRGMDRETADHIFEPFFSTKGEAGTGLGLSTVYGIVKQGGGFIKVYSEEGHGTTFKLYFPRHAGEGAPEAHARPVKPVGGRETILVAEDEEPILQLTRRILEEFGYTVLTARSPGDAVILAERHGRPLDLLLTDVIMPVMNGKELAQRLRSSWPGLRVLYMSGFPANVIAHRGILDEGVEFLQKPFTVEDLALKVREVLDSQGRSDLVIK